MWGKALYWLVVFVHPPSTPDAYTLIFSGSNHADVPQAGKSNPRAVSAILRHLDILILVHLAGRVMPASAEDGIQNLHIVKVLQVKLKSERKRALPKRYPPRILTSSAVLGPVSVMASPAPGWIMTYPT